MSFITNILVKYPPIDDSGSTWTLCDMISNLTLLFLYVIDSISTQQRTQLVVGYIATYK
jgi:hypothetical protein